MKKIVSLVVLTTLVAGCMETGYNNNNAGYGYDGFGEEKLAPAENNTLNKVLNTKKFVKGIPDINEETSLNMKKYKLNYKKTEIQEVYKFKTEINYQINIKTSLNNYKQSYYNTIVQNLNILTPPLVFNSSSFFFRPIPYPLNL